MLTKHLFPLILIGWPFCPEQPVEKRPLVISAAPCCGTQPVDRVYHGRQIFIPNLFTPNGDGFSDYFMPHVNDDRTLMGNFTVMSAQGDSILFAQSRIDFSNRKNRIRYAWNGLRKDGTCYQGLFKYRLQVETGADTLESIEGTACSMLCNPKGQVFRTKDGCLISTKAITD